MRRIYIFQTLLVVFTPLLLNMLIFFFDLDWIYPQPIPLFLGVDSFIVRKAQVDKASQCMPISPHPHIPFAIIVPIYNLFLQSFSQITISDITGVMRIDSVARGNAVSFASIECLNGCLFLSLNLLVVILFQLPNLLTIFLPKSKILLHDSIHSLIIHVHVYQLFALLQSLVSI